MGRKLTALLLCVILLCSMLPAASAKEEKTAEAADCFGTTISAGQYHMAAVRQDGSLWVWGSNAYGALGCDNVTESAEPMKLLENVSSVIGGSSGAYGAILNNGELWNWGLHGNYGRLGREADGRCVPPGIVMKRVRSADMGTGHSAAVTEDGTLWLWGNNSYGQLGNGRKGLAVSTDWQNLIYEPLPFKTMTSIRTVETGKYSTFAIDTEDTLWAWGMNDAGELGNGRAGNDEYTEEDSVFMQGNTFLVQTTPVKIMENVAMVSAQDRTAILQKDGTLWTCGDPRIEWDEESRDYRTCYEPQKTLENVWCAATGGSEFAAICSDWSLWTWGYNDRGQLGVGADVRQTDTPVKVMDGVVSVTVGDGFMAALKLDGSLWTWGNNDYGQLGNGTKENAFLPVKVRDGVAIPSPEIGAPFREAGAGLREDWGSARFYQGNAYILYRNYGTWEEARKACEQMGGHLATITSRGEQDFIDSLKLSEDVWLGGMQDSAGNWKWITGEKWDYTCWGRNEPNNSYYGSELRLNYYGADKVWQGRTGTYSVYLCEWEKGADPNEIPKTTSCVIYFEAKPGYAAVEYKTGAYGQTYGTLPTPKLEGYTFTGWYTEPKGGTRITSSSVIQTKKDHRLYAHWTNKTANPTVADLSYAFGNNASQYGYPDGYRIPFDRYAYIFGSSALIQTIYSLTSSEWGGNCFGMSTTASILYVDNGLPPSAFHPGAEISSQLSVSDKNRELSLTLRDFIECMQISQDSERIQIIWHNNNNEYSALANAVYDFYKNGQDPVIISVEGPNRQGGHAVVGCGLYRAADQKKDLIKVYDPNFPGAENRYIELFWSTPGNYTGWHYYMNDRDHWGSGNGNGRISFIRYSDCYSVWCDRGSEVAYEGAFLSIESAQATVYDYAGNRVAEIRDGMVETDRKDIVQIRATDFSAQKEESRAGVELWVPAGYYYVVNDDPDLEILRVSMSGGDQTAAVSTSSDRLLCCSDPDRNADLVYVDGFDESYDISFVSSAQNIRLTGTTSTEVPTFVSNLSGEICTSGVELGKNSELEINGASGSAANITAAPVIYMVSQTVPKTITSVFQDVPGDTGIAAALQWAYENRIVTGTSGAVFSPEMECTREDALTWLWRSMGRPGTSAARADNGPAAQQALLWGEEAGVFDGRETDPGDLEAPLTTEQFLDMVWAALGNPGRDQSITEYETATVWAENNVRLKNVAMKSTGSEPCTRGNAIQILYSVFG